MKKNFRASRPGFATLLVSALALALSGCAPKKAESSFQPPPDLGPKWGFIDHSGKFVIKPLYRRVLGFSEGLAAADLSARWGYIDNTGAFKIERSYEEVLSFHKGYAAVRPAQGKWGLIDKTGNMVIPPKYEAIGDCGNASTPLEPNDLILCPYRAEGKWGFIEINSASEEPKIAAKYENVQPFSEGFAAVSQLGKWGFIDKTGKQITDLKFDQVSPFRDRVAEGHFGSDFVIIGDIGTISMSDPLKSNSFFHDGLGLSLKKGKYGFINKAGKTVIKRKFTYAEDFSEGFAVVGVANARRGFIDVDGSLVIPPVFDEAYSFSEKLAAVKIDPRLVGDDGSISASAIEEARKNDPHASKKQPAAETVTGTGTETGSGTETGAGTETGTGTGTDAEAVETGAATGTSTGTSTGEAKSGAKAEPAKTDAKAAPAKAEPAKTEPAKTEPAKTEPTKTDAVKTDAKAAPAKVEAAKTEPAKTEAGKPAAKSEPAKEPAKTTK